MTGSKRLYLMKLLTINVHSLQGKNWRQDLQELVEGILREQPDLIAMQEVNQTSHGHHIDPEYLKGMYPIPGHVSIRRDNYAALVANLLQKAGVDCSWVWLPVKRGYDIYDEGVAIISMNRKIQNVDIFPVSRSSDYMNWRTRKVLGVRLEGLDDWFYCIHMGWWHDTSEPFLHQWKVLSCCVAGKRMCGTVWLLGDFNAPTCFRGESYDAIAHSGWYDAYQAAQIRKGEETLPGNSDGLAQNGEIHQGMRLDQIWCSERKPIRSCCVVFDGKRGGIVSDHYGVLVETGN